MGKRRAKTWLLANIGIGSLVMFSYAAFSQKGNVGTMPGQKVDWGLFLPAGEGKFETSVNCITCHSLQPIVSDRRFDETGWTHTVQTMQYTNDANIQPDDAAVIAKYLTRFFGQSTPKLELPIYINAAPKETLLQLGALSDGDVQKILDARSQKRIDGVSTLDAIVGSGKLAKYRSFISFEDGPGKSK